MTGEKPIDGDVMNVAAHHDGPAVPAPDIRACKAVEATTKLDSMEIAGLMSCDKPRDDGHWSLLLKGSRSAATTCGDP